MKQNDSPPIRILVIDDNEAIHEDFKLVLTPPDDRENSLAEDEAVLFGEFKETSVKAIEIDFALQGLEGLESMRQASEAGQPYTLAFVDVRMPPGIDGIETIKGIWQIDPHVQVVLCTAYSDYAWTDLINEFGETDRLLIMKKPFESIEVRQMVSALSEKWRLVHNLENKVRERTQNLERTNEQLERFSYLVSHDLKAPLRGILTLIDWITTDSSDLLNEPLQANISLLKNRARLMQNLIDRILEYSRAGHGSKETEPVDFNEIVAEVIELIQPPENIDITISTPLPTVIMGKTHAFQIFQNLLSNAVKYIDKPHGVIRLNCERLDGFWKLSVADNGPGIEEQHFDNVFVMFKTLGPKITHESTGVGLAIVKEVVDQYGGQVGVESELDIGTTFWFTIADSPLREGAADAESHLALGAR